MKSRAPVSSPAPGVLGVVSKKPLPDLGSRRLIPVLVWECRCCSVCVCLGSGCNFTEIDSHFLYRYFYHKVPRLHQKPWCLRCWASAIFLIATVCSLPSSGCGRTGGKDGVCSAEREAHPPPPAWKFHLRKGRRHRPQPWEPAGLARTTQSAAQLVRPGQGWGQTRGRARPAGEAPSCAPWETNAECLPCAPTAPWEGGRSPPPFQMGARSPLTRTRRGQAGVRA